MLESGVYLLQSEKPAGGRMQVMIRKADPDWAQRDEGMWGLSISWSTPVLSTSFLARLLDPVSLTAQMDADLEAIQKALTSAGYSCEQAF